MGKSLPPPAAIDLVGSYARRRGSDVEVVLWEPKLEQSTGVLVFRKGRTTVDGSVELIEDTDGRRLVSRTPRANFTDGTWSMTLRAASGDNEPVDARLLVQGDRPLVLLWGAKGQPSAIPVPRSGPIARKRKAVETAGRALDRMLSLLPPERAATIRARARTTARRILG